MMKEKIFKSKCCANCTETMTVATCSKKVVCGCQYYYPSPHHADDDPTFPSRNQSVPGKSLENVTTINNSTVVDDDKENDKSNFFYSKTVG